MPLYECSTYDDFVLHDWCTQLPKELRNHVGHPQHTLSLLDLSTYGYGVRCDVCGLPCNGFMYCCLDCFYFIDVHCAFMPKEITHEAHPGHLLTRVDGGHLSRSRISKMGCRACRVSIVEGETYYICNACDFFLDCRRALHLPKTIRHKHDKHSLKLSYSPIEDHKSQYFCEVCEEGLDPGKWFYHCAECAQSIHSACAPLILKSEQGVNYLHLEGVYKYINIKFAGVRKLRFHQHPMTLAAGTENDGFCPQCGSKLQSHMIWKCIRCNFAVHCYHGIESISVENPPRHLYLYEETKPMRKQRGPQKSLEFYPSEIMRPVTRHWKVVDNDIQ